MALTDKQVAKMKDQIRKESEAGRPEIASRIRLALDNDREYEVETPTQARAPKPPPTGGLGSSTKAWQAYAREVSEIDEEIISAAGQEDLIGMLRANGIIPFPEEAESG